MQGISNTWIAHSPSPETADSNDSRTVDGRTDKRPRPFVFDVFAEDVDGLVNDGQPLAKWRRRAFSTSRRRVAARHRALCGSELGGGDIRRSQVAGSVHY